MTKTNKTLETYEEKFGCKHHPAECDGDCKEEELAFLTRVIQKVREQAEQDGRDEYIKKTLLDFEIFLLCLGNFLPLTINVDFNILQHLSNDLLFSFEIVTSETKPDL